jgi:hypothetical protein
MWVTRQRTGHTNAEMQSDRKDLLDEIGFAWNSERARKYYTFKNYDHSDNIWNQQHEKLVEFKRQNGHCVVPRRYEQDKSLGLRVSKQRGEQSRNKMRPDRKELLDVLAFVWKAVEVCPNVGGIKLCFKTAEWSKVGILVSMLRTNASFR